MNSGARIADRYRLLAPLGGGTPSMTFLAVDESSGAEVVLKRFAVRDARGWKQVELAQREAQVLRGLDHELLPRYLDHFEQDGALFTVMTRLPGEDLRAARRHGRRFTVPAAFQLLRDGSSIFEYLHEHLPPIVHRDIKPSNVLICPDGRYRLVDFGSVAQALRADGTTVVGTFGYMAPEQFQGRAGPGSDIYGLGATLLTTLTGVEPEQQPHRGLAIDVEQALGTSVHPHLRRLLQAMLEPNPDLRPTGLRPWLEQASPLHAGPSHAPNRPARVPAASLGPQENQLFLYTLGLLVFLLIAIVSLMWIGPSSGWALLMMAVPPALLSVPRLWRHVVDRQLPASADLARSRQSGGSKRAGQ